MGGLEGRAPRDEKHQSWQVTVGKWRAIGPASSLVRWGTLSCSPNFRAQVFFECHSRWLFTPLISFGSAVLVVESSIIMSGVAADPLVGQLFSPCNLCLRLAAQMGTGCARGGGTIAIYLINAFDEVVEGDGQSVQDLESIRTKRPDSMVQGADYTRSLNGFLERRCYSTAVLCLAFERVKLLVYVHVQGLFTFLGLWTLAHP